MSNKYYITIKKTPGVNPRFYYTHGSSLKKQFGSHKTYSTLKGAVEAVRRAYPGRDLVIN